MLGVTSTREDIKAQTGIDRDMLFIVIRPTAAPSKDPVLIVAKPLIKLGSHMACT